MTLLELYIATLCLRLPEGLARSAFAVFPGLQSYRLTSAPWWVSADRRVWVAGTSGDPAYDESEVRELMGIQDQDVLDFRFQGYAEHTADQMAWVVDQLLETPDVLHLYLSTSGYHLPRCVLTFAKVWARSGDRRPLQIGSVPTLGSDLDSAFRTPLNGKSGSAEDELKRIIEYQGAGYVGDVEDLGIILKNRSL